MVSERIGFALTTQDNDSAMLRNLEAPLFPNNTYLRTGKALHGEPIENQTRMKIQYFYEYLLQIQEKSNGQIFVGQTMSNFCVVEFNNPQIKADFIEKLKNFNSGKIPAKRIIGLPLEGSGQLLNNDLNNDGTLKDEVFKRNGIIGLSANAIRLSALNHPFVLDVLEDILNKS